jgi:hypothetical protein
MSIDPEPSHGETSLGVGGDHGNRLRTMKQVAIDEARRFLVMFIYLWLLLGLFALHEDIVLRNRGIGFVFHGFALINALVLAKVMLIAEDLKLGHRLRAHPLIYPIATEALILATLFIVVHVLEHVIGGLIAGQRLAASVPSIGGGGMQGLLCVSLIMFVTLLPFLAFRHISRELGRGRIEAMLFGRRTAP